MLCLTQLIVLEHWGDDDAGRLPPGVMLLVMQPLVVERWGDDGRLPPAVMLLVVQPLVEDG